MQNHSRRWLYTILAVYLVLASIYSIVTPIFEASDELWHYPMVQYLATHGLALPPQTPGAASPSDATAWRQEGSQPPLYYLAAAVITAPIDTSDLDLIRRQNPHADIGTIRPDGNVNMIVHHTAFRGFSVARDGAGGSRRPLFLGAARLGHGDRHLRTRSCAVPPSPRSRARRSGAERLPANVSVHQRVGQQRQPL